jgi:hypothetical protein
LGKLSTLSRDLDNVRSNSQLLKDQRAAYARAAYAYAIKHTSHLLENFLQVTNTLVSTQVCDDQDRTIGVIRGKVTLVGVVLF